MSDVDHKAAPLNHVSSLSRHDWTTLRQSHCKRVSKWTRDRVTRAGIGDKHPVYDFLFTYYSFRPAYLDRWSPGADVVLEDISESELDWPLDYVKTSGGYLIPSDRFPVHRIDYLTWAIEYLETISKRPPIFNCFGLHEWAMLYRIEQPRHSQVPLRLSPGEINQIVEQSELRCTHYDAFRFFTPAAATRNRSVLLRQSTTDFDQAGCVHVTMDLYKFAHKIAPWCPSDLVADTFLLALAARELDMRASPYDLTMYGFAPIMIELPSGRAEYVSQQRELHERALPLRERLLVIYQQLALNNRTLTRLF